MLVSGDKFKAHDIDFSHIILYGYIVPMHTTPFDDHILFGVAPFRYRNVLIFSVFKLANDYKLFSIQQRLTTGAKYQVFRFTNEYDIAMLKG